MSTLLIYFFYSSEGNSSTVFIAIDNESFPTKLSNTIERLYVFSPSLVVSVSMYWLSSFNDNSPLVYAKFIDFLAIINNPFNFNLFRRQNYLSPYMLISLR